MQKIVDEYWRIEYQDWEAKDNPEKHIFLAINSLKNHLEGERRKEKKMKKLMRP